MKKPTITPEMFRHGVKWLGTLLLFYLVSFVLYAVTLASMLKVRFAYGEFRAAFMTVLIFDILFWLIVTFVWTVRGEMSLDGVRRKIVAASKEEGFSLIPYFFRNFAMEWVWKTVFFFALQIPFTIFFGFFGLNLGESMIFLEKIYISVAGFYGISGSAILGLLFSTLYFYLITTLLSFLKYYHLLKNEL